MNSYLSAIGVILTGLGAIIIGGSDVISKNKAIELGTTGRAAGDTPEENEKLPLVQEFLRRRRNSSIGLALVLFGTIFLVLASLL